MNHFHVRKAVRLAVTPVSDRSAAAPVGLEAVLMSSNPTDECTKYGVP